MLYKKYLDMHIKSSFEYRLNLLFIGFSQVLITIGELFSIWLLFHNFKSVGNWSFYESSLMFGIITTIFAFTECFARGYDDFSKLIKTGELDRLLVRPVNLNFQIFGSKIEFSKAGRIFVGIIISIISLLKMQVNWTVFKVLVLLSTYVCGVFIIWGLFLISAGISVFTVEKMEFINILCDGGKELSFYPINIYNKHLARIFTFIIPLACFNYLPLSYIMGTGSLPRIVYALSPFVGCLFVIPCFLFFNWSVKKYQGTGT